MTPASTPKDLIVLAADLSMRGAIRGAAQAPPCARNPSDLVQTSVRIHITTPASSGKPTTFSRHNSGTTGMEEGAVCDRHRLR